MALTLNLNPEKLGDVTVRMQVCKKYSQIVATVILGQGEVLGSRES